MKKIALIIFAMVFFFISAGNTFAQKETGQIDNQINQLKERIASRVAQLKLVERRGLLGTVTAVSATQITLSDQNSQIRYVDVDELTKFNPPTSPSAPGNKNFGISDIKQGDTLGILGLYNKQSQRLLARFVDEVSLGKTVAGTVSSLDAKNFTAVIITDENKTMTLNFDTATRTFSYTVSGGFIKSGFSKIKPGNFFVALGSIDSHDKTVFNAKRVFVLPEITSGLSPSSTPVPTSTQ